MFKEVYRLSTFFVRRLCVRSSVERAVRAASGASPCETVLRVELRADSIASTSACSVSTLSSSFFSRVGASAQVRLSCVYVERMRCTYEIGQKAGLLVEVAIVHKGPQWELHKQGVLHARLCPVC